MSLEAEKPVCYIVAGPNGAGKTTFAMDYLPEIANCRNFINADMIAQGISPLDTVSAQYEAGRLFLQEIHKNIANRRSFAFETTLAGRSHLNLIKRLKKDSWRIVMYFMWVQDADFSRDRVRQRVEDGGHDIPENVIYRRYPRIMHNFIYNYMPLCDELSCYDNSNPEPVLIFERSCENISIKNNKIYNKIIRCADEYNNNK
jgi:predicted ABC-type ATPase